MMMPRRVLIFTFHIYFARYRCVKPAPPVLPVSYFLDPARLGPYNTIMRDDADVFSSLAAQLDPEERSALLERISKSHPEQSETLIVVDETDKQSVEQLYETLGFFKKLFVIIKSILMQRDRISILEEALLERIGRRIINQFPGVFDYRDKSLGAIYQDELRNLQTSLANLSEPFTTAFGGEKRQFIAFLASLQMPLVHERLVSVCDIDAESELTADDDEFELKKRSQNEMQDIWDSLPDDERNEMYHAVRSIGFLKELVFFPFSRIDRTSAPEAVSTIEELADLLHSIRVTPSKSTVSTLVLYTNRDSLSGEGETRRIEHKYEELSAALHAINRFCSQIPLVDILKVLKQNIEYTPESLGGGEEWFNLYRQYWEKRLERAIKTYAHKKKRDRLQTELDELYETTTIHSLDNYVPNRFDDTVTLRFGMCSQILVFVAEVLFESQISRPLKLILINGEFYKPQNREELTDTYNNLSSLGNKLRALDRSLELEDQSENTPEAQLRATPRRKKVVLDHVETELEKLIRLSIDYLDSCINIIKGILRGESGEKYDTLSNVSQIGGSDNARLMSQLARSLTRCESTKRLLHEAYDLEQSYVPELKS